jgi:hypothetical protein
VQCNNVPGQTSSKYFLSAGDIGKTIVASVSTARLVQVKVEPA